MQKGLNGLAGAQFQKMNWPDPSPAQSLSLMVGQEVGGDLVIRESLVPLHAPSIRPATMTTTSASRTELAPRNPSKGCTRDSAFKP